MLQARAEAHSRQLEWGWNVSAQSPRSKVEAALWAVSRRTGVSVEEILGRQRIQKIASACHKSIWQMRRATDWSLPRVGKFFADREHHTTVLHSSRCMESRASRDSSLRAYMRHIERACAAERRSLAH